MKLGFASFHPFVNFYYYIGLFLFSLMFLHPFFLMTILLSIILLHLFHDRGKKLKRSLPFFLSISVILFVVNPLISHRGEHIWFYIGGQPITFEAILYGFNSMLSLLVIMVAFLSYNRVITSDKFLFLFASFFPKGALLTMMATRFVPLLQKRYSELSLVQRTRGLDPASGSLKKRASEGMQLMQMLLTASLEDGMHTADSIKARGYGTSKRTVYFPYRMASGDWLVLGLMLVTSLVAFGGWFLGYGRLQIYPELEPIGFTGLEWVAYLALCLFVWIPIAIEGREEIRWHLLK